MGDGYNLGVYEPSGVLHLRQEPMLASAGAWCHGGRA